MDFTNPANIIAQPSEAAAEVKRLQAQRDRAWAALRNAKHDPAWEEEYAQTINEAWENIYNQKCAEEGDDISTMRNVNTYLP